MAAGQIVLTASSSAAEVALGAVGAVIANSGPGTVFYSDRQDVASAPEGMIAPGAAATLFGTQFLFVAIRAAITVQPLDADPGDAGSVVARIAGSVAIVTHGAAAGTPRARPNGTAVGSNSTALWVGSVVPINGIDGDLLIQTS
jgi:hypothetical protein